MSPNNSYQTLAQDYAERVEVLFARSGVPTGEGWGRGPASPEEMAAQAEQLSPVSGELTQVLAAQLRESEDMAVCTQASVRLLALALTDLEISASLLEAARDEELGIPWENGQGRERSVAIFGQLKKNLQILLGHEEADLNEAERGGTQINDIPTARKELSETIEDTIDRILEQASDTGELALRGLMGLGLSELTEAVGLMGMGIAEILGQAENVSRLYEGFRQFLQGAWDSIMELLGKQLAQAGAEQMLDWVQEFNEDRSLRNILERIYQTKKTKAELTELVSNSQGQLDQFTNAISDVTPLGSAYSQQINLAGKLLKGLKRIGTLPAQVLPQGQLIFASIYILLGTYVIMQGADYLDAPQDLLDRVPGVRRVVEAQLPRE